MTVEDVVAEAIARARRNVARGLPFEYGADPDATLSGLGLPHRSETREPRLDAEILRLTGSRRLKRRGPRRALPEQVSNA